MAGLSSKGYLIRPPGGGQIEAYHIDRFGGVDGIVLRSRKDPRPGPKEILIRVRAAARCRALSDRDRRHAAAPAAPRGGG
jgi:hypothetical protein